MVTKMADYRPSFLYCVICGKPDQITITIIIEQNVEFQVGIYLEKFRLDQIQNGRPAATYDQQIFSLTQFTQNFFMYRSKLYTIYPFH